MQIDFSQGWRHWYLPVPQSLARPSPYDHDKVEIVRAEWDEPRTVSPAKLAPEMNGIDLYWRPLRPQ